MALARHRSLIGQLQCFAHRAREGEHCHLPRCCAERGLASLEICPAVPALRCAFLHEAARKKGAALTEPSPRLPPTPGLRPYSISMNHRTGELLVADTRNSALRVVGGIPFGCVQSVQLAW